MGKCKICGGGYIWGTSNTCCFCTIKQLRTENEELRTEYANYKKLFILGSKAQDIFDENERLKKAIDIARGFISKEGDCVEQSVRKEFEQALKGNTDG